MRISAPVDDIPGRTLAPSVVGGDTQKGDGRRDELSSDPEVRRRRDRGLLGLQNREG